MRLMRSIALLGATARVCSAHSFCMPGGLCATTPWPVCPPKATATATTKRPTVPRPRPTFPCAKEAYVLSSQVLHTVDLETGSTRESTPLYTPYYQVEVRAIAYNIGDYYLYGTQGKRLLRIFRDGKTEEVLDKDLPISKAPNMGGFDHSGTYWCSADGQEWVSVNLQSYSRNYKRIERGKSRGPWTPREWPVMSSWAYTPKSKEFFYSMATSFKNGVGTTRLVRWSIKNKEWTFLDAAPELPSGLSFRTIVSTFDGVMYGLEQRLGRIMRFDVHGNRLVSKKINCCDGPKTYKWLTDATRCMWMRDGDSNRTLDVWR